MTVPADTLAAALAAATHRGGPSWREVGRRARHVALGLVEGGLPSGALVGVTGPLGADRTAADLAVMAAGAATTSDPGADVWRTVDAASDLDELAEKGAAADGERPDRFEELVASVSPSDVATVAAGHRLTHRNLVWGVRSVARWLHATAADRLLVHGDAGDVATRLVGPYLAVVLGAELRHDTAFGADGDRPPAPPTILFAAAPFWDRLAELVTAETPQRTLRLARARAAHDPLTLAERARARISDRSLRAAQARLGLGGCRAFVCLGPLPGTGTRGELAAVGVDVLATWGHPGVGGLAAAGNPPCPLPGVTIGIDDDGLVAVRSAGAAVDLAGDGWLRTGEPGTLDPRGALLT